MRGAEEEAFVVEAAGEGVGIEQPVQLKVPRLDEVARDWFRETGKEPLQFIVQYSLVRDASKSERDNWTHYLLGRR